MGGTLSSQTKAEYCNNMTILYLFESQYWSPTLDIVMAISATIFLAIAFQIIRHKHLQSHPAPLIAALTLFESFFGYMGVSRYFVCKGGNSEALLAATLFFDSSEAS